MNPRLKERTRLGRDTPTGGRRRTRGYGMYPQTSRTRLETVGHGRGRDMSMDSRSTGTVRRVVTPRGTVGPDPMLPSVRENGLSIPTT